MKRKNAKGFGIQKSPQHAAIWLLSPVRHRKRLNFVVFSESVQLNHKQYSKNQSPPQIYLRILQG